jgi:hypothetical protein
VALVARKASAVRDRRLGNRHARAYLTWLFWGSVGTYVDSIHEAFGVVAYPNPDWIGEKLPVSPAYLAATTGFFALYTLVVGHRPGAPQGWLGGEPVRVKDIAYALVCWLLVYSLSGALGAPALSHTVWPFASGAVLALTALPALWQQRRSLLPVFALLVVVIGTGFEWLATSHGLFAYPVCPSPECGPATVPLAWLPLLYVHAALFMHRLLGGAHLFKRSP